VKRTRVVWLCGAWLLALQVGAFHRVRSDDAYITYRYGQNLASGLGLVFNPGQRVQGSTSPGQMLLAALGYAGVGPELTPSCMAIIGCVAWSMQAVALYWLLLAVLGPLSAALIALAVGFGAAGSAGWVPLETHLVAAAVLLGLLAATRRRWLLAAMSCGIAVLFRPDACLAAGLVLLACLVQERRRAAAPIAVFLSIALPWPLFAWLYYGSPLPQTAVAKFQRVGVIEYLFHELSYPSLRLLWPGSGAAFAWLALALAIWGGIRLARRGLWLLPAYGLLHAAAYLYLRPFMAHGWHLYPWVLTFCVCVFAGLAPVVVVPVRARASWVALLGAALCLGLLVSSIVRFVADTHRLDRGYWTGQRDAVYRRVAEQLMAAAEPGDWFASVEVGTIAYHSRLHAFDLGGLVTRADDVMSAHPIRFIVVDKAYLQRSPPREPRFVVSDGDFLVHVYDTRPPPSRVSSRGP
jgi:arabinofuranosyltransferase